MIMLSKYSAYDFGRLEKRVPVASRRVPVASKRVPVASGRVPMASRHVQMRYEFTRTYLGRIKVCLP